MATLVIKNDGIGDLVLSSGIIAGLAEKIGPVDLVTCHANREIAEMIPGLRRIIYTSRDGIRLRYKPLKVGLVWPVIPPEDAKAIREIRKVRYDTAICLRRYIRTSSFVLMNSARAKRRIGCWIYPTNLPATSAAKLSRGWILDVGKRDGSEADYYSAMIERQYGDAFESRPRLTCSNIQRNYSKEDVLVGFCLSGASSKWPDNGWSELADMLINRGLRIVLFGGENEKNQADALTARYPRSIINKVGKLNFTESAVELIRLSLLISNDTGFAHFASLYAYNVLIIMGGGTWGRFFPWPNAVNQYLIQHQMDCYDCDWRCIYSEKKCLKQVKSNQVAEIAIKILNTNEANKGISTIINVS